MTTPVARAGRCFSSGTGTGGGGAGVSSGRLTQALGPGGGHSPLPRPVSPRVELGVQGAAGSDAPRAKPRVSATEPQAVGARRAAWPASAPGRSVPHPRTPAVSGGGCSRQLGQWLTRPVNDDGRNSAWGAPGTGLRMSSRHPGTVPLCRRRAPVYIVVN